MPVPYRVGEQVRGLVNIKLSQRSVECTPGYLFTIKELHHDGTITIYRDEVAGRIDVARVPPESIEPCYTVVDGTYYSNLMCNECVNALELCRRNHWLVHLHYGYQNEKYRHGNPPKDVGLDWMEEFECRGHIGRSTGSIKIPLIVPRKCDSGDGLGGGSICGSIVMVRKLKPNGTTDRVIWKHSQYRMPSVFFRPIQESIDGKRYCVEALVDGQCHAKFRNWEEYRKWCKLLDVVPRAQENDHNRQIATANPCSADTTGR